MSVNKVESCETDGVSKDNPFKVGLLPDAGSIEPFQNLIKSAFSQMASILNRSCYEAEDVEINVFTNNTFTSDKEMLYIPFDTSVFDGSQYLANSAWMSTADVMIISKSPDKYETTFSSFIQCEDRVIALFLFIVAMIVGFFSLFAYYDPFFKKRPWNKSIPKLSWNVLSPVLDQAMVATPRSLPSRLLLGSWLLSTLVIGIYLSSFLKSKLSLIGYQTIDRLADLESYPDIQPTVVQHQNEHLVLKKLAAYDEGAKNYLNRAVHGNGLVPTYELVTDDRFYRDLRDGKRALLCYPVIWSAVFDLLLVQLEDDEDKILYYGKLESFSFGVMTVFFNKSLPKTTQEILNLELLCIDETMYPYQFLFRNNYLVERNTWRQEMDDDFSPITLKDIAPILKLNFFVQFLTLAIAVLESAYDIIRLKNRSRLMEA